MSTVTTPRMSPQGAARKARAYRARHGLTQVDPAPARQHLERLIAKGWTTSQIEKHTGASRYAMRGILNGRSPWIRHATAQKILALSLDAPVVDAFGVPCLGTMRRIQALYACSHTLTAIATHAGLSPSYVSDVANGRKPTISSATVEAVAQAYGELSMKVGASVYNRNLARKRGWAGPLHWDDDIIDDPGAFPDWTGHCGTASGWLLHTAAGEAPCGPCTPHAVAVEAVYGTSRILVRTVPEALVALANAGLTYADVATILGISERQVEYANRMLREEQLGAAA